MVRRFSALALCLLAACSRLPSPNARFAGIAGVMVDDVGTLLVAVHGSRRLEAFGREGRLWKTGPIGSERIRHMDIADTAVPVLLAGRTPDDVAGTDLHDGTAPALHESASSSHDQHLSQRMGVPR